MTVFKIVKRYLAVNILMIIGLALSYFILVNASSVITSIINDDKVQYTSNNTIDFVLSNTSSEPINITELINDLHISYGILYIHDLAIFVGNSNTPRVYNLILTKNDNNDSIYKYTNKGIVIGRDILDYCKEKNNKTFITIFNNEYTIAHVLNNNSISDYDSRIYINFNLLKDSEKDYILYMLDGMLNDGFDIPCTLVGTDNNINTNYKQICEKLKNKYSVDFHIEKYEKPETIENNYKKISSVLLVLMYLFCILNNFIIARLWINIRTKELAVRRAYGYSIKNAIMLLLRDLGILTTLSLIIAIISEIIYCHINKYHCITVNLIAQQAIFIVTGIFLITFIIITYAIKKINSMTIAYIFTERSNL